MIINSRFLTWKKGGFGQATVHIHYIHTQMGTDREEAHYMPMSEINKFNQRKGENGGG